KRGNMALYTARRALIKTASALAAATAAPNTKAQEGPIILDDIVIQGELRDVTVQDSQTSVAVITGDELEQRSDFDLYDVVERTPGVTSAFGEKGFVIRGIDQRGVGGGGSGLLVSTTVDGATISNSNQLTFFGPYSNWDLEQIEILRGPQSTQTGRNALAGAINIRSKDPIYDFEGKVRVEGGLRGTGAGSIALNLPFEEDGFAIRLSGDYRQTNGFVENPTLGVDDYDARQQGTFRAAVRVDPTDDLEAIFKLTYSDNQGGEDFVDFATFPDQRLNFSNEDSFEGTEITSMNFRLNYDMSQALRFESETTYFDADYERQEDVDFSAAPIGLIFRSSDVQNFETQLKMIFEYEAFSGVIGGFYTNITDDVESGGTVPATLINPALPANATVLTNFPTKTDTENYALFGEFEYRIMPQVGLIAGGRFDHETISFTSSQTTASDNPIVAALLPEDSTNQSSNSFNVFLPKVGIVFDATDDLSFGFTVQRGYRSGGTRINLAAGNISDFGPERTWNYEGSIRSQWFDRRLTVNANAFYTSWTDQQVDVVGPSGTELDTITVNAGRSELFGGELEIRAQPTDNLDVYASAAYVETQFKEFVSGGRDFSGNEFPFAPKLTAAIGAAYNFDNGFFVSGDASYTDSSFFDAANTAAFKINDRFLVNARVGYRQDHWEVFAYARNLFDKDYFTSPGGDATTGQIDRVRTGEPFTVGLVGAVRF
ncbi:MAG: TonB-dependent receptor, partial [Pseudomonadota bacterium]